MDFEEVEVNSERWLDLKDLLNEEWRDIEGYEGRYQVSNYGRIKSLRLKLNCNLRNCNYRIKKEKIKKMAFDKDGYCDVGLFKNSKRDSHGRVHRLVAKAFIPNPENKPVVNHKNRN